MSHHTEPITSCTWVCLCNPSDIRNVAGSIRAVANFHLAGIKVITRDPSLAHVDELRAFSSGASEITSILFYETLEEAMEDASILIGTTRRERSHDHLSQLTSTDLTTLLRDQVSPHLLFGNERVGLSHSEVDLCHATVALPSHPSFPSLNLAHAVACIAYELARPSPMTPSSLEPRSHISPALPSQTHSIPADSAFLDRVMEVSSRTGYPPGRSPERFARRLRSLLRRAQGAEGDYGLILGMIRELDRLTALHKASSLPQHTDKADD